MKKLVLALLLSPALVLAQGPGPGAGMGPGPGAGPGRGMGRMRGDPERMDRRMRLARTLGLAEALDLDAAQALKLGEQVAKFDERRLAAHKQLRDAHDVLRDAAAGEKVGAQEIDQAIQKALEARSQVNAIDKELVQSVVKDLAPEQRARAVLFLDRFQRSFRAGPGRELKQIIRKRLGAGPAAGPDVRAFAFRTGPGRGPMTWSDGDLDFDLEIGPGEGMLFEGSEGDVEIEIQQ